jgi:hypothetical protein
MGNGRPMVNRSDCPSPSPLHTAPGMGITTVHENRFVGHPEIIGQKSMFEFASRATPQGKDNALQPQIGPGSATHRAREPACHRGQSPLIRSRRPSLDGPTTTCLVFWRFQVSKGDRKQFKVSVPDPFLLHTLGPLSFSRARQRIERKGWRVSVALRAALSIGSWRVLDPSLSAAPAANHR